MDENKKVLGVFSSFATFIALVIFARYSGGLSTAFTEFLRFVSGDLEKITRGSTSFLAMFPVILAVVVMELPCTIGGGIVQRILLGEHSGHALSDVFEKLGKGHHFKNFFLITLAEEICARWFFLGVLTKIPFLSGTVASYTLMLIGNALWALVHLRNFKREKDRHPLRTLPQFIAGFFFAYIFVKFGLMAAVLTHFASNAILFALHKVQRMNSIDALIIGYALVCGVVSYATLEKPIAEILPWFAHHPTFVLPGWSFWDYLKVSVLVGAVPNVIFGLLAYDRGNAGPKEEDEAPKAIEFILAIPITLGAMFVIYWLLGFVITDVPFRVLAVGILLSFLSRGASGSAMSRTFWVVLPNAYVMVCIMQALGFWLSVAWVLVEMVIHAPNTWLMEKDD